MEGAVKTPAAIIDDHHCDNNPRSLFTLPISTYNFEPQMSLPAKDSTPLPNRRVALARGTATVAALACPASINTKSNAIRIGQIGVGHAHASKLAVYRESPDYEVVGIVEPNPELRARAQTQMPYRELPWMTREQLLNQPGLQAVLIETEVENLLDNAAVCIAAGMHIHVDKPAGNSLPQLRRLLAEAETRQLLVQMGYMFRYNPAVQLLRKFLAEGWLGEVFELHTVMSKVVPPADRQQLSRFPGGIMFELGCHVLDLVVGILGEPTRVTPYGRRVEASQDNLLDNMLAVLEYPRALATIKSTAVEVEGFSRRHLVVCGTEGTFHIQPLDNPVVQLALAAPQGEYRQGLQTIRFPEYVRYVGDAADMAKIIRGEKPSDFSTEHDLIVQTTLLRACGVEAEVRGSLNE
jgi:predicted dehydrogenase